VIGPERTLGRVDRHKTLGRLRLVPRNHDLFLCHEGIQKGPPLRSQPFQDHGLTLAIEPHRRLHSADILQRRRIGRGLLREPAGQPRARVELGKRCQQAAGVVGAGVVPLELRITGRLTLDLLPAQGLIGPSEVPRHTLPCHDDDRADREAHRGARPPVGNRDHCAPLALADSRSPTLFQFVEPQAAIRSERLEGRRRLEALLDHLVG